MNPQVLPLDYYVQLQKSEDELEARLTFSHVEETFVCSAEQLEGYVRQQGIVHGLDTVVLQRIASSPVDYRDRTIVVAAGTPPRHGADGRVVFAGLAEEQQKRPLELEDGTVDYKEITRLTNVRKGELLARLLPPEPAVPGMTVTGKPIPGKPGREARFSIGKNVVTDAEGQQLYAVLDGMLVLSERGKVNVFPIFEVNGDVDYHVGNISFNGSVVIRGNVLPGFRIKADGDIRITGGVEAADLEAGGGILIAAGILGQNKGMVKAGKTVKCSFIQDARVDAGEDVIVSQSIMHSVIHAGRSVLCSGAKGLIVGGTVQAGGQVEARTIGNLMNTQTVIEVGVLPELRNELSQLRVQARELAEHLDKTEKALAILDQLASAGQLSGDKLAMRIKLSSTRKQTNDELGELRERVLEIELALEDNEQAHVKAVYVVYPGTKLTIGRCVKFVKDPMNRVVFRLDSGDIACQPL
ncbi:polymerase [Paenibacillus sp. J31TS4]|uniref:FapA family protein n=1 Tax=Paenibacillus sp. J31TS4 TaxID=2807195 RepID=UPI001B2C5AFC|nr:FapA family protein [Paenibacillus sp. J31TS4]GIP36838.1 polymerase [Paenibacillus sp. J31TS4]